MWTERMRAGVSLGLTALIAACAGEEPDAYGNFEAIEVTVSSEVGGRLAEFSIVEGERVADGVVVARVDTVQAALELAEVRAQLAAGGSQAGQATAQAAALQAELRTAEREHARTERLHADRAATQQQLERTAGAVDALRAQLRAAMEQANASRQQADALEARLARLTDRLERSRIANPVTGTVLATYVEAGEFIQPGQPLYRVANLDTLLLRVYITGAQLATVRIGQPVEVAIDTGPGAIETMPGVVSWISDAAEFTPTPIQTRETRTDLVYAVRVRVPNPRGLLKIGMPGEVTFPVPEESEATAAAGSGAGSGGG